MCQPLKQISKTSTVAWSPSPAAPTLLAMGTPSSSCGHVLGNGEATGGGLDFVSFDLSKPGQDMDVLASIQPEGGRRFSSMSWGSLGVDQGTCPYGILAGGLHDGSIALWNPHAIVSSRGQNAGLIHSCQVHRSAVNCVEFNPVKSSILATCGSDGEVNVLSLANPAQPEIFKPSSSNRHANSEVLCCAWNRKLQHILCSCSNTGTTVVWDLKMKKEVISFSDPAQRQRCSAVAWSPEIPTQLLVAYDDDRNPSMQMWDLRNCQYPFKETAGHTKGILGVSWNPMDPNLLMSCGKDSKLLCWCLSSGSPEIFCEIPSQQGNMEVKWAPHKPSIVCAPSFNGVVNIYSTQQQQSHGVKYCPRWYSKPCGVSFGFGGKMLAFGTRASLTADLADKAQVQPAKSWCQSLIVPNEPEVVPAADAFEQWIAQRNLRDYCHGKTNRSGDGSVEELMWEMMGLQFDAEGRRQVPAVLGFESDKIMAEAERFLGKKPGTTLADQPPEQNTQEQRSVQQQQHHHHDLGPSLNMDEMESFFDSLSQQNEQKQKEEMEREQQKQLELASGAPSAPSNVDSTKTNWSSGPESTIKHALLTGNLTAAVECCFKSGRMAEALLLASGGGTSLWTRARDEYLRLQDDPFLTTVGNIMTSDFEKLVSGSDLSNWKETLAILATYSGQEYNTLCEQLAERLEKEKFDIRSAVICYICASNFPKTVNIWANTTIASHGSQKLALQELVEKMAVLQEATKFAQTDPIFSSKIMQYAEMLANSGRLTAAMRYLCLLQNDVSSSILRDRIYNSAPQQMSSMFGRPPACPFQVMDVRIMYQPKAAPVAPTSANSGYPVPTPGTRPTPSVNPSMPPAPCPTRSGMTGPAPCPAVAPQPQQPPQPPRPMMSNMPPAPKISAMPGPNTMRPPAPTPSPVPVAPDMSTMRPPQPTPSPMPPVPSPQLRPPSTPQPSAMPTMPARPPTAPQHSAMPVIPDMPVSWPVTTETQQRLSTTTSVAEQNMAIQRSSAAPVAMSDPLPPHELQQVKGVFGMLLESAQPNVREDASKKLEVLYDKLQAGALRPEQASKVVQMSKCVEEQDYQGASKLYTELCTVDWNQNKHWLLPLRRLLPQR